jgi:hypothetical protein
MQKIMSNTNLKAKGGVDTCKGGLVHATYATFVMNYLAFMYAMQYGFRL